MKCFPGSHTRASVHQAVKTGNSQEAVTLCTQEGNCGPGADYWKSPPGVHLGI